jgi:hypothetical protein
MRCPFVNHPGRNGAKLYHPVRFPLLFATHAKGEYIDRKLKG